MYQKNLSNMSRLQQTLSTLKSKIERNFDSKRIDLLADWLHSWGYYIDQESSFDSTKRRNYAAGDIVSICLGFNIGSEQGGNRPALVIGRSSRKSKTILVVPLGSLDETQTEKDLRYFECFLGELKDFNLLAGKPAGTNSKAIINQIRTISKQRIIKPTSNSETCVNIGPEKLKLVEEALIKSIKTIDI